MPSPSLLIDTDTCIYLRRKRPPKVVERLMSYAVGEVGMSVITYGELRFGAEKLKSREALEGIAKLVAALPVQPMPARAGEVYGAIRASLEARGEIIGTNDLWIAAHALALGVALVTNNEREFRRVEGLKVENWTK